MSMNLLRLNGSTFKIIDHVEGWDSLIWTERYNDLGDFQLKTEEVDRITSLIATGSYLSIAESDQVMVVENKQIDIDDDENAILTITGRSADCILEERPTITSIGALGSGGSTAITLTEDNMYIAIMHLLQKSY